jgi:transposase
MTDHIIETIGCDLGDKVNVLCVMKLDGSIERHRVKATPVAMQKFFNRPTAHVVIEVGAHSRWVASLLEGLGHKVTVANPFRVKLISSNNKKTDDSDAELLGRLGRADAALLAPITHRSADAQADLAVAKARDALVAVRTRLINHVRSVVKTFGERLASCSPECFARRTWAVVPAELKPALEPLYETLAKLHEQICTFDKKIEAVAKKYPDVEIVSQPNGVGTLTALVFILTLEDKSRFRKSRAAGAYLGLRPRKSQSGASDPQLGITKAGDTYARRLLVSCANYILGPFGADSDLRRWGLRLAERGGKNARQRAKVAVARKLAVLLHRLWVTGEMYQPLGYAEQRTAS